MSTAFRQSSDPRKIPADWAPSLSKHPPARGPWKDEPPKSDPLLGAKHEALALLRSQKETVYGLFDAAKDDRILELLREYGEPANLPDDRRVAPPPDDPAKCEYESLYISWMKEQLGNAGPWIVRLPKNCVLLEKLVMEGWGGRWGYYIACKQSLFQLRSRFRRFLLAQIPDGRVTLFRIADPMIARTAVRHGTSRERLALFGGRKLIVECDDLEANPKILHVDTK